MVILYMIELRYFYLYYWLIILTKLVVPRSISLNPKFHQKLPH